MTSKYDLIASDKPLSASVKDLTDHVAKTNPKKTPLSKAREVIKKLHD